MSKIIVTNNGPLRGEVYISGAKNSALPIIAAALLCDEPCIIENVPNVSDINNLILAITNLGAKVKFENNRLEILESNLNYEKEVDYDCLKTIRASYYLVGAMLSKYKKATIALPGGCQIGLRPIDIHIKGFKALGAETSLDEGNITVSSKCLKGVPIFLDFPSVGATINIMLASIFAEGTTIIRNCAKEPHIVDVANFLNSMGAKVFGAGTGTIKIDGVKKLHSTTYRIIPDQIEAGTFMVAGAMTKGNIILKGVIGSHLDGIACKLRDMGAIVSINDDTIRVYNEKRLLATNVKTGPYPMFPTDMQPQIAVACGIAEGTSLVNETIFENRFMYTNQVNRLGGNMYVMGNLNVIEGVEHYKGAKVYAPDLRAGAALVLAGLVTKGKTTVENADYIFRGYEDFDIKLRNLGANIKVIQ